eukprot:5385214-Amphidinium_carterae.1
MAYIDDLLVVGDTMATQQFLLLFQQHLELKHTTQLTNSTSLEVLQQDPETVQHGEAQCFYNTRQQEATDRSTAA